MENASKALIMAGEVLIGVLVLSLLAIAFRAAGSFSKAVDDNIQTKLINEFNVKFENYNKDNLTAQDVITIANLAKECGASGYEVVVLVEGVEAKYQKPYLLDTEDMYNFIQKYSYDTTNNNTIFFKCKNMEYNEENGKINKIIIKKM
jgi:hypothetical protein